MGSGLIFSIEKTYVGQCQKKNGSYLYKHGFLRVSVKELFRSAQAAHDDRGVATQRAMTLD